MTARTRSDLEPIDLPPAPPGPPPPSPSSERVDAPAVDAVESLYRKEQREVSQEVPTGPDRPEPELATAPDHVPEDLVERERVLARPPGDQGAHLGAVAAEEPARRLPAPGRAAE